MDNNELEGKSRKDAVCSRTRPVGGARSLHRAVRSSLPNFPNRMALFPSIPARHFKTKTQSTNWATT